jgi:SAM-dependent methyltransferase
VTERNQCGDDPLERARRLASGDDARALYDRWAATYDDDVFTRMGVTGSGRIAALFAHHVPDRSTSVLDLGCGTGAVGGHLAAAGFRDLVGVDISPGMLDVARRTGAYRDLVEGDLTDPPAFDQTFEGSVSAGTFTTGHVPSDAVPGLIALLRTGATIAWVVHPMLWPGVSDALVRAGVQIISSDDEPIRPGGGDRSHMVVGKLLG